MSQTSLPSTPLVGILMGSKSDQPILNSCALTLAQLGIPYEMRVLSAHRTPDTAAEYSKTAEARGLQVIICAAGVAAHLAGVTAAHTVLPVLGIPLQSPALGGLDALLSTVQMPGGIPVATFAIGKAGAINAALFAAQIIATKYPEIRENFRKFRQANTEKVLNEKLDPVE